jgi:desulfoferrodoxin (superoxide reductase-like protein)
MCRVLKLLGRVFVLFLFLLTVHCVQEESTTEGVSPVIPQKEYTGEEPGQWAGLANDHIPKFTFNRSLNQNNLRVEIPGRKFNERHYIEAIGIMDEKMADIDVKILQRGDIPIAILTLDKSMDPKKVKVFAKCNLHDLWTHPIER